MRRILIAFTSILLTSTALLPTSVGAIAPTDLLVTIDSTTSSSVTASWTADEGEETTTYDATISPDTGGGAGFLTASGLTSTTFTGLDPGVSYTVSVVATNLSGSDSDTEVATTLPLITTFNVASGGSSSVNVDWAATGAVSYSTSISPNDGSGGVSGSTATSTSYTNLDPATSYTVTLRATNAGGFVESSASAVTGAAAPPVVGGVTVTATGANDVDVSWANATGVGNTYSTSISPNGGLGGVANSAATSTSYTGLTPGVLYTVTVTASNTGGTVSNTGSARTLPLITTFNVASGGSSSVNVDWAATGAVSYSTSISPNDGSGGVSGSTATSTSYTNLDPATSYTVTLRATNAGGFVESSASAVTGAAAPPVVGGVTVTATGANDVDVSWANATGVGNTYSTSISPNGGLGGVANSAATSTSYTGLTPGVLYTVTVTASNTGGTVSNTGSARTPRVPDPVTGVAAVWAGASNINAINVSWSAPAFDGGTGVTITGYVVTATPDEGPAITEVREVPGETSRVIGGLEQGETYTVTVKAQNQLGDSVGASVEDVLVPTTPGTVTDLVVGQTPPFSSSIVVTWDLPDEDGGSPITGFTVSVDGQATQVGPADTTADFQNLPVGDNKAVSVQAITAAGDGPVATSLPFEVKGFPPFDSEEAFVTQIYADFLRRAPDAGGLAFWTDRVANDGSNVQDIVEAFMRSPEFAPRRSVARLYFAYFNRQPDKGGFDFWTRQISTGASVLENASQSFALSPEFIRTYGSLNNAEFIVLVYNNVLARRPDQGGFEFWLAQLSAGMPRGTLMTLFSESPENIPLSRPAVDVTVTYDGMLQRAPDVQGFLFWTGRVNRGGTGLTELIRQFYFSVEYADRVNR